MQTRRWRRSRNKTVKAQITEPIFESFFGMAEAVPFQEIECACSCYPRSQSETWGTPVLALSTSSRTKAPDLRAKELAVDLKAAELWVGADRLVAEAGVPVTEAGILLALLPPALV
jgi:hypothetical protein